MTNCALALTSLYCRHGRNQAYSHAHVLAAAFTPTNCAATRALLSHRSCLHDASVAGTHCMRMCARRRLRIQRELPQRSGGRLLLPLGAVAHEGHERICARAMTLDACPQSNAYAIDEL